MKTKAVTDFLITAEEMGKGVKLYVEEGDYQEALRYLGAIERGLQRLREHLQKQQN